MTFVLIDVGHLVVWAQKWIGARAWRCDTELQSTSVSERVYGVVCRPTYAASETAFGSPTHSQTGATAQQLKVAT
jgi:hypothetical protein